MSRVARGLLCGYGEAAITPPREADLCGYGFYLDRKAERVGDPLKVRALYLRRGEASVVIVACDLIGLGVETSDGLRDEIGLRLGLPRAGVMLACTHTHSGPATVSMPGLGDALPAYIAILARRIAATAEHAECDARPARASWAVETIEPIGFNRRTLDFRGVDADLKTLVFDRGGERIHLWSYACHAVVLGPKPNVSADWPGAAARALEAKGRRGLFLQGFCGDIDPVSQRNRWGEGTKDDLALYGGLAASRLIKAERHLRPIEEPAIRALEGRVDLPIQVYNPKRIRRFAAAFAEMYKAFPGGPRFAEDWMRRALAGRKDAGRDPLVRDVPVQAMGLGPVRLAGLPGEVFSEYGPALRRSRDPLFPVGFANGVVGYIPTRRAYSDPTDYAAWCAPMFYRLFPFQPDAGARLMIRARSLLGRLGS
jgi:neutral ceramidase